MLLWQSQVSAQTERPEKCGMAALHKAMIARDPSWADKIEAQRASLQANANYYRQYKTQQAAMSKDERATSAIYPIAIVFHIIVDSAQFNDMGGTGGIIQRCNSQIAVLNEDFNHQNADSTSIPSAWKALYGNPGISFGLATTDPSGNPTPGYEVRIITGTGFDPISELGTVSGTLAEKTASGGLAAWDVTRYYNIWCVNYTGSSNGLLGLTEPMSNLNTSNMDQEGVDILYSVLGSTGPSGVAPAGTGSWFVPYNLGRTLTHETGHFFEIWHPWGDDNGQCPTWSSDTTVNSIICALGIGYDDGLGDTPPESNMVYGHPTYNSVPGVSGGTIVDCCQWHGNVNTQPIGIACISFLDYTDDDAMHLFTPDQAAAMASMVLDPPSSGRGATGSGTIGENYGLTQNPGLATAVAPSPTITNSSLSIYPNPTTGNIYVSLNSATSTLHNIVVVNLLGQQVATVTGQGKDYYIIDLSGMTKGIYFVTCNFASGSVTRKILLQ